MTHARTALLPLLIAGCAPMAPSGPPPSVSQQPVRSAYDRLPAPAIAPQLRDGRITSSDYPGEARRNRSQGEVAVVLLVGRDGRVNDCRVDRTSGDPALDDATCRLIADRFRYDPAQNAYGEPVEAETGWVQAWEVGGGY